MKNKVLIYVEGGMVQNVYASDPNLKIVIVDTDVREDVATKYRYCSEILSPDMVADSIYELFTGSDPVDTEIREDLKRMKF